MKVQVLIDLLYEPGRAQQAAKDLALIAEATEAADKNAQALAKDYERAEQAASSFGTRLDTTADSATTAADAVLKAEEALSSIGSGFGTAESGANAAASAFARTGEALAGLEGGADPFAKLDGSMARAERQAQQLASAVQGIERGAGAAAGTEAVDAALRTELRLAEETRAVLSEPVKPGALVAVEETISALKRQLTLEEEIAALAAKPAPPSTLQGYFEQQKAEAQAAREALAAPATDGALAAVEATNKALKEEAALATHAHEAVAAGVGGRGGGGGTVDPASRVDDEERRPGGRGAGGPTPVDPHGGPGLVGTIMGFEEVQKSWELAKESIHAASDTAHEHALMNAAGLRPEEVEKLDKAASDTSRAVPTFSNNEMLELARDARSILGSSEHAAEAMPEIARLAAISEAYNPGHGLDGLAVMLKGAESGSFTGSPEKFQNYLDAVSRSTEVFSNTIKANDWGLFFKYAGTAGQNMNMEFVREKLPHLIQELGGNSAGQMFQTLDRAMVGGIMTSRATEKFLEYGLLDESKVHKDHGKYKIDAGALNHGDEAVGDFAKYIQTYLKPLFDAKNLSPAEREHEISAMFSNQIGARGVAILMNQEGIMEKNAKQIRDAKGLEGYDSLRTDDPHLAARGVESQFGNFSQIAGGPLMPAVLGAENTLTNVLSRLNQKLEDKPEVATGIMASLVAAGTYVGAKTLQMLPWESAKATGEFGEAMLGGAARMAPIVGAGIFVTDTMLNRRDHSKALVDGGRPDVQPWDNDLGLPGLGNDPDVGRTKSRRHRRPKDWWHTEPEAPLPDLGDYSLAANPNNRPKFVMPEPAPVPATGGTATPSLAQPVVNNTTNNNTTNAPVTVNAPVSVTVNVSSPTAAPAAVGAAVGSAAAGAMTSAVKQSPGVLHDGYGPH